MTGRILSVPGLDPGELAAIAMAEELEADALLMDERDGRREAERRGLPVLGTLRVLADAAEHGLTDLQTAFDRLRQTNFRVSEQLFRMLLDREVDNEGRLIGFSVMKVSSLQSAPLEVALSQ